MKKENIIKKIIKEAGVVKGIKILLPYCIPTIKIDYNQVFLMIPDFKTMIKFKILAAKSINRFNEQKQIKNIEQILPL